MPIVIEPRPNTPIQQESLNETGWSGFNTPRSSNVGQTYGPGGMGMRAYMNRPGPMPSNIGRDRMGIMSQPGGYGSDTYNALVGGMNRSQQDRGFDRGKWSSALGRPELAAVDPSDWRTWEKIILSGGNPDDYEVTGIMGAMPEERQMAEISGKQGDWMGGEYGNPEHYSRSPSGFEDYKSNVEAREDTGSWIPWRAAQEPATDQEIRDRLKDMIQNKQWGGNTPTLGNFKQWGIV